MRGRAAMVTATAAVLAALAFPGAASAGGFATVGLSSLPDGTAPGKPWHVTLTILQHGRTPLSGLSPEVRIRSADGFSQTHQFAPVAIGTAASATAASAVRSAPSREGGANLGAAIAAAAVAGLLAALLAGALMHRRRPGPAPAAAR